MSAQNDFLAAVYTASTAAGQYSEAEAAGAGRFLDEMRERLTRARQHEERCRVAYLASLAGETWQPLTDEEQPVDVRERLWAAAAVVMRSVAAGDTSPEDAVRSLRDLLCATNRWDWMADMLGSLLHGLDEEDLLEVVFEEAMKDPTQAREMVAWLKGGGIKELVREVTSLPVADADGYRWEVERWDRPVAVFTERKLAEDWARTCGGQLRRVEPPGWASMDTAPRDGTEVLLQVEKRAGIPGKCLVGHWMIGGLCIEDYPPIDAGWYFWNGCAFDLASKPTGWKRVPS